MESRTGRSSAARARRTAVRCTGEKSKNMQSEDRMSKDGKDMKAKGRDSPRMA